MFLVTYCFLSRQRKPLLCNRDGFANRAEAEQRVHGQALSALQDRDNIPLQIHR
jgi:hypothetical protein